MPKDTSFTVIWRSGGPDRCFWYRCTPVPTQEEANNLAASIERMGYKALIHQTSLLNSIGMPEGWKYEG